MNGIIKNIKKYYTTFLKKVNKKFYIKHKIVFIFNTIIIPYKKSDFNIIYI